MVLAIRGERFESEDGGARSVSAGEHAGVFLDRLPEWADRDLEDDEVHRVRDLAMLWLRRNGFSDRQVAQVFWPDRCPDTTRHAVQKRLARMGEAFAAGGFTLAVLP